MSRPSALRHRPGYGRTAGIAAKCRPRHRLGGGMTGSHVELLPSAGRLMSSLRDIGYDLPSAVADLVDNAIDANARHVDVTVVADGANSTIRVSDNGDGLSAARLDEAMRYGSHADYQAKSLG